MQDRVTAGHPIFGKEIRNRVGHPKPCSVFREVIPLYIAAIAGTQCTRGVAVVRTHAQIVDEKLQVTTNMKMHRGPILISAFDRGQCVTSFVKPPTYRVYKHIYDNQAIASP